MNEKLIKQLREGTIAEKFNAQKIEIVNYEK